MRVRAANPSRRREGGTEPEFVEDHLGRVWRRSRLSRELVLGAARQAQTAVGMNDGPGLLQLVQRKLRPDTKPQGGVEIHDVH
jgi:hypothetical protein